MSQKSAAELLAFWSEPGMEGAGAGGNHSYLRRVIVALEADVDSIEQNIRCIIYMGHVFEPANR